MVTLVVINKLQTNLINAAVIYFLCQTHKVRHYHKIKLTKKDKDQQQNEKETKTRMPKNGIATCL